jgi:ParB/RepB/Spo0J family partition protein
MTVQATETLSHLATEALVPSTTEVQARRRKRFDKGALTELAASIRQSGVLQPIIARGISEDRFEIVAGERRWLSAKSAGLVTVPAIVRTLTDSEVLQVQLVENLQREELHPLEEAEGYEELLRQGLSIEQLMEKIGKRAASRAYVYGRLKLCALSKASRQAFYDGKLTASTALLIARIPGEALQAQALKDLTQGRFNDAPMSAREAATHIQRTYMLRLAEAPFDRKDVTLVPDAGPCGACPKRSGNQPELFADVKGADVCTDPQCFSAKRAAWAARRQAQAREQGLTVIAGDAAKKLAPYGAQNLNGAYIGLDQRCHEDPKARTYRQLLGKGAPAPALLEDVRTGAMVEIVKTADIATLLEAKGIASGRRGADPTAKARDRKLKIEGAYRARLLAALRAKPGTTLTTPDLLLVAGAFFDSTGHDHRVSLVRLWGWLNKGDKSRPEEVGHKKLATLTPAELVRFLIDCALVSELRAPAWSETPPTRMLALAARHRIDARALRREAEAQLKSKETSKPRGRARQKK